MPTPVIAWDENAAAASKALGCRTVTTLSGSVLPKKKELVSRFQIGSIKGECNYGVSQAAFHITNVPPAKLAMKRAVKRDARPDPLGTRGHHWNVSRADPAGLCVRRQCQTKKLDRDMYRFNYRTEVCPPGEAPPGQAGKPMSRTTKYDLPRAPDGTRLGQNGRFDGGRSADPRVAAGNGKRTGEMPVHPILDSLHAWDGSAAPLPHMHATNVMLRARRESARAKNSRRKGRALEGAGRRPSLTQRFKDDMEVQRARRAEQNAARSEVMAGRPSTAHPGVQVKRNRYAVEPNRRVATSTHSGVWEYSAIAGCKVWSDTMSEEKDSRGDTLLRANPDQWNMCPLLQQSRNFR
jgi:hypothetical protein